MKTWTESWTHAIAAALVLAAGVTTSCGTRDVPEQQASRAARAFLGVTGAGIDRVLGMEAPTSDWKILWSTPGTLGTSTTATQGSSSLSIQPPGYVPMQSAQLSSLGSRVGTALKMDVQFQGTQVNPWWWGTLTIAVDIPSLGIQSGSNGVIVNSYDFTNKLSGGWTTLSFDIPAALQTALAGSYSDLQVTIIVNVPSGTTGTYLIDNLRFLGGTSPPPTPAPDAGVDGGQGCTLPTVPTNVFTDSEDGIVGLAWTGGSGASSYKIQRTDSSGATATFTTTATIYADTSVTNGTTYSYSVVAVNACGASASSATVTATPTATTKISLYYPRGVSRDQVVLAANGALSINDRDKVLDADGNPGAVSNAGSGIAALTYSTILGAYSSTGSVRSVGPVFLRSYGKVEGKAKTGGTFTMQDGAQTSESPEENATLTPLTEFSWSVRIPAPTGGPVPLEPNQERTLDPGSYTSVTVKTDAILRLSAGIYYFTDLDLESRSQIHVDKSAGPIEIYVSGNVIQRGDWIDDGGPEGDLLLVCLGTQGVSVEQVFKGTIIVPNAKLTLGSRPVPYRGTFYGKDLESHQDNVVQALPFSWGKECVQFGCLAPDLCHGPGVCDAQTRQCGDPAPKVCVAQGPCRDVGVCDPDNGTCSDPPLDKIGCNVFLRMDGVVEKGDGSGNLVAIFGYDSTASKAVHPTTNTVLIDGKDPYAYQPPQPAYLVPGSHPGAFLATFAPNHTITWHADSESKSAMGPATLTATPDGSGTSVDIGGGVKVPITPNMDPYKTAPAEPKVAPAPAQGNVFNGVIPGQLTVGSSGEAIYTVPIAIPPGIAGMAPNLNLVYTSQGMDGIAGQGWSISGLSMIYRCSKTRLQDGYAKPVAMDSADVATEAGDGLCLDGKRLFLKSGSNNIYESEFADFSEIRRGPANAYAFAVTTKSGETRYYGTRSLGSNSIVSLEPNGNPDPAFSKVEAVWALDWVEDPWGNSYSLIYNDGDDARANGLVVKKIEYTRHSEADPNFPPEGPFATIDFTYEARPDQRNVSFHGGFLPMKRRLKSIGTPRGTYSITYVSDAHSQETLTLPSRLRQIDYYCAPVTTDSKPCIEPLVFDWDAGGYGWLKAPEYALPSEERGSGTALLDLDGDGRPEFIVAKGDQQSYVWRNTGKITQTCPAGHTPDCWSDTLSWPLIPNTTAWQYRGDWDLPVKLAKADGELLGTKFADLDNDGLPDLITDHWQDGKPRVFFNRMRSGSAWQSDSSFSGDAIGAQMALLPQPASGFVEEASWRTLDLTQNKDLIVDMDGDGRADIVHYGRATPGLGLFHIHGMFVLRNTVGGWIYDSSYTLLWFDAGAANPFRVVDLNRDGLPDVTGALRKLNTGDASSGSVWKDNTSYPDEPLDKFPICDVDGDGQYDSVTQTYSYGQNVSVAVAFGAGLNWSHHYIPLGGGATGSPYFTSLKAQTNIGKAVDNDYFGDGYGLYPGKFTPVDVNADGLTDIVVSHQAGGRLLVNTGAEWKDFDGYADFVSADSGGYTDGHYVPVRDDPTWPGNPNGGPGDKGTNSIAYLDQFVDLDGDGVVDRVTTMPQYVCGSDDCSWSVYKYYRGAWLNQFHPPIIKGFPDGLAKATKVTYVSLASDAAVGSGVYEDSDPLITGPGATKHAISPLRVVSKVTRDNGVGGTNDTTYKYLDLRESAEHHGTQGFRQIQITDATGIVTTTTYYQVYPYTGRPKTVERSHPVHGVVSQTDTTYTTTHLSGNQERNQFVYPLNVKDTAYLPASTDDGTPDKIVTLTENTFDTYGNPTKVVVTTTVNDGESYRKTIDSIFGQDGSDDAADLQRMGKATWTRTTTEQLAGREANPTIQHVTVFKYKSIANKPLALPMGEKVVEPKGGDSIELHSAYDYDRYGNLTVTTSCASDFDKCEAGIENPNETPDGSHPPFRSTWASYDPAAFVDPSSGKGISLPQPDHVNGRFLVKTTNALNQSEYSVYDPLTGALLRTIGPNGISTCYQYDAVGWKTKETARCGTSSFLVSEFHRYYSVTSDSVRAKVMAYAKTPTGAEAWTFSDTLGRTVETLGRSFDGKFVEVLSEYDSLGRVSGVTKPFFPGDSRYWAQNSYDWLGRISTVKQDLGIIDGVKSSVKPASSQTRMVYSGARTNTYETVLGIERPRGEKKNALGKVAEVFDASASKMSFFYDVEGNLTRTEDPKNTKLYIYYDLRGRKKRTVDPDAGEWQYTYNSFGDLLSQTDAKGQVTTMNYDRLGRMVSKTDSTGTSEWVYDVATGAGIGKLAAIVSAPDNSLGEGCSIPNTTKTDGNRSGRWFTYNSFGDVTEAFECIDGDTFSTQYDYDSAGRQSVIRYPQVGNSRFAVKYNYNSLGFLQYLSEPSDGSVYWKALAMNAAGQITDEQTRNGVETTSVANPALGWLLKRKTTSAADDDNLIQGLGYAFDEAGNLMNRTRSEPRDMADSSETFVYDSLDRLATATVSIPSQAYGNTESYFYDKDGNLTQKGDHIYTYGGCGGAGPHSVCKIDDGTPFLYDKNGSMTQGRDRDITYTPLNKVKRVSRHPTTSSGNDTGIVDFFYGAEGNRVVQSVADASGKELARTVYVGIGATGKSVYERTTRKTDQGATETEHVQFIYAGGAHGGSAFALRVVTERGTGSDPTAAMKYNHFDHLGSVTAMSDDVGRVVGQAWGGTNATVMGYDAWGARQNPDGSYANPASFSLQLGHREYTGHEAIPNVGLVNMNGRVYDPDLGRFLSPDTSVQFIANLQSYNRYSYVLNNPLRYTDPTGYHSVENFSTGSTFVVGLMFTAAALACVATEGAGCGLVVAVASMAFYTTAAIATGADPTQAIAMGIAGFALGFAGGAIAGSVAQTYAQAGEIAAANMATVIGGGISSAAVAGFTGLASGRGGMALGANMLLAFAQGAAGAAVGYAIRSNNAVSVNAEDEQQGVGDGYAGRRGAVGNDFHAPLVCGEGGVRCPGGDLPAWIRNRSEEMLVTGTTNIADPENPIDEITVNLKDASVRQNSQVEYSRIAELSPTYDTKYSRVFSGTGGDKSVHVDISDDLADGSTPLLIDHTHVRVPGGTDYLSAGDKRWATAWGVPIVAWSPNKLDYSVYIPDGRGVGTGICLGSGCMSR